MFNLLKKENDCLSVARCGATKIEWKIWNTRGRIQDVEHSTVAHIFFLFLLLLFILFLFRRIHCERWGSGYLRCESTPVKINEIFLFVRLREIFLLRHMIVIIIAFDASHVCVRVLCESYNVCVIFLISNFLRFAFCTFVRWTHTQASESNTNQEPPDAHATIHPYDRQHDCIHISIVHFHLKENLFLFFSFCSNEQTLRRWPSSVIFISFLFFDLFGHVAPLHPRHTVTQRMRVQWHRFLCYWSYCCWWRWSCCRSCGCYVLRENKIKFYVWTLHDRTEVLKREGASRR